MSRHNYHGAEYVDDHDDHKPLPEGYRRVLDEVTDYMKIEKIPEAKDTYTSLEEILQDINNVQMFPYHMAGSVPTIKEKLRATINMGYYIQSGTE